MEIVNSIYQITTSVASIDFFSEQYIILKPHKKHTEAKSWNKVVVIKDGLV